MGSLTLLAVFSLCLLIGSVTPANTIQCYKCHNCPVPFDETKASKLGNCNYCRTMTNYGAPDRFTVEKECVVSCTARDNRRDGYGIVVDCCTSDLCNPAMHSTINRKFLTITTLGMIAWVWKTLA